VKKSIFAVVLIACFVTVALAADHRAPATVGEYSGLSQVRNDVAQPHQPAKTVRCIGVSQYYYYSGNFDSTSSVANGLANEADTIISSGAQVYQPFTVKKTLSVTGLCENSLDESAPGIDNPTPYEVRTKAAVGTGGTLTCHGTATSSDKATGRSGFGIPEYTHAVKVKKCSLKKGQHHMNVEPQCFKASNCSGARFFQSTDDSNLDHVGAPTNKGAVLWNSAFFGYSWVNPNTVLGGNEALSESAGVSGK